MCTILILYEMDFYRHWNIHLHTYTNTNLPASCVLIYVTWIKPLIVYAINRNHVGIVSSLKRRFIWENSCRSGLLLNFCLVGYDCPVRVVSHLPFNLYVAPALAPTILATAHCSITLQHLFVRMGFAYYMKKNKIGTRRNTFSSL